MISVAIVEDSPQDADTLKDHLQRYIAAREDDEISVSTFQRAEDFLTGYKPIYDVVFMDIELPGANGMSAARAFRVIDPYASLVFVTNIASYAASGYDVDALAYLLKPVKYPSFILAMDKALRASSMRQERPYVIQTNDGVFRMSVSAIYYVEVRKHILVFHTQRGTLQRRGSMRDVEEQLGPMHFCRCHNGYLVNLEHVTSVRGNEVLVGEDPLPISRQRKQAFLDTLAATLGA